MVRFMKKKSNKFRKQLEKQSKLNVIKTWLTSLSMTVGVVFLVVVFIPKSPKATFVQVTSHQHGVYYQVHVTDEDQAIETESLKIVLTNQLENYEQSLSLGFSLGAFENLKENTQYQLSIMANKGFGYEVLASQNVKTNSMQGGIIANVKWIESEDEYLSNYLVDVKIFDDENAFKEVFLYAKKIHQSHLLSDDFSSYDEQYQIINQDEQITLESIYKENFQYHIVLVAVLNNDETIILDEVYFYTPYHPYAYFYIDYVSADEMAYSLYHTYEREVNVVYEVILLNNHRVIRTYEYESNPNEAYHYEKNIIKNLKPNTSYEIKVYASYVDPDKKTSIRTLIHEASYSTIESFEYEVSWIETEMYYEIQLIIKDEKNQFDLSFFEAYEILEDGNLSYFQQGSLGINDQENEVIIVFNVYKNHTQPLEIAIGLRVKEQYFNRIIVEKIKILPKEGN
jgi:hypothetical protein